MERLDEERPNLEGKTDKPDEIKPLSFIQRVNIFVGGIFQDYDPNKGMPFSGW